MEENVPVSPEPKVEVKYTDGHVTGRFRFKFKQHWFNWAVSAVISACSGHSIWLHYHINDQAKTIVDQQKTISDTVIALSATQIRLAEAQAREVELINALAEKNNVKPKH